jgi:hypothetical protein
MSDLPDNIFEIIKEEDNSIKPRCVVRLTTSTWSDERGVYKKQSITYLKRLCFEYNILDEDSKNIGANEVIEKIVNLHECEDGIYKVITCNPSYDWESGYLDDYDYQLIPFKEEKSGKKV